MYIPKYYSREDRTELFEFMKNNNFGILFSHTGDKPMASHLPFVIEEEAGDQGLVLGHMAKANLQWRYADGQQVMVVFHGPHTYISPISPTLYQEDNVVPTWNYVAVHATGIFKVFQDRSAMEENLSRLTDQHESSQPKPWQMDYGTEYADQMIKRVVGFQIEIFDLSGKWKLSQNHSEVRRRRVSEGLKARGDAVNLQVARLIDEDIQG